MCRLACNTIAYIGRVLSRDLYLGKGGHWLATDDGGSQAFECVDEAESILQTNFITA